ISGWVLQRGVQHERFIGGFFLCPCACPHKETDEREDAIKHVHKSRSVITRREQERYAHDIDDHPNEPELYPALSHAVGCQQGADKCPGICPDRFEGTEYSEQW